MFVVRLGQPNLGGNALMSNAGEHAIEFTRVDPMDGHTQ